jgi:hypothetical protein
MPLSQIDYLRTLQNVPGLTAVESAIALAWLNDHWRDYDTVNFNVRLGEGVQLPPGQPEYVQKFARAATAKRADMILTAGNVATIVEVKIRIGASALGQLLTYQTLLTAAHPDFAAVHMIAAGATIESDVQAILESHGITVEVFPSVAIP